MNNKTIEKRISVLREFLGILEDLDSSIAMYEKWMAEREDEATIESYKETIETKKTVKQLITKMTENL